MRVWGISRSRVSGGTSTHTTRQNNNGAPQSPSSGSVLTGAPFNVSGNWHSTASTRNRTSQGQPVRANLSGQVMNPAPAPAPNRTATAQKSKTLPIHRVPAYSHLGTNTGRQSAVPVSPGVQPITLARPTANSISSGRSATINKYKISPPPQSFVPNFMRKLRNGTGGATAPQG